MAEYVLRNFSCSTCFLEMALPITGKPYEVHCAACSTRITVPAGERGYGATNGFCGSCGHTLDDHFWAMAQGSYEHACTRTKYPDDATRGH